jgi:hypothetical protein
MQTVNMEIIEVRGFDLFFENINKSTLIEVAKDLGGNSSFNILEMSATHMFEKSRYVLSHDINFIHEFLKNLGIKYQDQYGCKYKWSELYLKVNENGKNILDDNSRIQVIDSLKFG